ncbi:DNA-binding response regulator [Blautia sp. An249]|uniref:response regulator n=1 Tax=Blautia sp. An249 TaxID=1965603 RepID=UPI000B3A6DE4|nr:response regulator [Blautia sp. An249]OUO79696.1 DNA-binding response regulator [Blautia sp. An249]
MIKVFLVEDEVIMRKGIKNHIPWEKEGLEFVGEASDGELAYPLIKKTKPDILITDIKMPFMDGLELSSLVKKEFPNTKIIILSGYNEFDYAKRAISIGITDYLLKPVSREKLLEAIKRVAEVIREEQEQQKLMTQYQEEMKENLRAEKIKLFYALVHNTISISEILNKGGQMGMDFTASYYTVVMFKVISEGHDYMEHLVKVTEQVEEYLESEERILCFKRPEDGWFLLVRSEDGEEFQEILSALKEKVQSLIPEEDTLQYFGGIGKTVQRLRDVGISYNEANSAFASRFFMERNQIVTNEEVRLWNTPAEKSVDLKTIDVSKIDRKLVEDFLKVGAKEEVENFIENYFRKVGSGTYNSVMFRQYLMMDMYFCVAGVLESLGLSAEDLPEHYRDASVIAAQVTSVSGMKQYLTDLFSEALDLRDNSSMDHYNSLFEDAKKYIQENFQNNDISLNVVASQVGISPSYFSTLFRQELGETFIEYLTKLRMDRAKELLMCTNRKTSEIGFSIGYKDSHYFSYIFKKTQGCTPKEYRARRKEGPGK